MWHQHQDAQASPASPPSGLPFSLLSSPSRAPSWDQCLHKARGITPRLARSGLGTEHLGSPVLPLCPGAAGRPRCATTEKPDLFC